MSRDPNKPYWPHCPHLMFMYVIIVYCFLSYSIFFFVINFFFVTCWKQFMEEWKERNPYNRSIVAAIEDGDRRWNSISRAVRV